MEDVIRLRRLEFFRRPSKVDASNSLILEVEVKVKVEVEGRETLAF